MQTTCSFAGNANGSGKGSKLAFLRFIVAKDSFRDIEPIPVLPSVTKTI